MVSEFLPLVFVFSKIEQVEGGLLVARGGGTVINFTGKLIRSWTRYEWAREQCGINRLVIKTVQLAQRLQDRARDIRIWLTSLSFKQLLEFSRYKQRLYN